MKIKNRILKNTALMSLGVGLAFGGLLNATGAEAAWPERDVTVLVHSGAGSSTDRMARAFAKAAEEVTGKNFIVVVKGRDAVPALLKAKADGYMVSTQTRSLLGSLATGRTSYTADDLQWIARLVGETYCLAVRSDSKYKSLKDLFAGAKADPGSVTMATYKTGSTHQISALLLNDAADVKFNIIPFNSGSKTVTAMIGGNVEVVATNPSRMLQYVKAGKARVLTVTSDARHEKLPDVPTARELGYDVVQFHWRGLIGKKGIPASTLAEMEAAIKKITRSKTFQTFIDQQGLSDLYMGPEALTMAAKDDLKEVVRIIDKLKLKK